MNMREDLKAFVDNEVSESERTRFLREVEGNAELQAEVIELRQISRILSEETFQHEPVGLERTLGALGVRRGFQEALVDSERIPTGVRRGLHGGHRRDTVPRFRAVEGCCQEVG